MVWMDALRKQKNEHDGLESKGAQSTSSYPTSVQLTGEMNLHIQLISIYIYVYTIVGLVVELHIYNGWSSATLQSRLTKNFAIIPK